MPFYNLLPNLSVATLLVKALIFWKKLTKTANDIFRYILIPFDVSFKAYSFDNSSFDSARRRFFPATVCPIMAQRARLILQWG